MGARTTYGVMKDVIVGLAIGVGVYVTAAITYDGAKPPPAPSECYQIVSVRPQAGVAITFNMCTGRFGLSRFPNDVDVYKRNGGSADGAFLHDRSDAEI